MNKYWKEYYILGTWGHKGLQLINNWHLWNTDKWYLFGVYRIYHNGSYDYYISFFGFQLRLVDYAHRRKENNHGK